jgi:hypothetical protein
MPKLLPQNRTTFETAASEATERVDAIQTPLRALWRPDIIPESILPYLAWAYSVDVWDTAWPLEKKRWVTDKAIWLHRIKGTETGIGEHVKLLGGRLIKAITPPAKTYLMPQLTTEEREAFYALFPQLRIFPFVERGTYRFAHFTSQAYGRTKAFLAAAQDSGVGYVEDVGAWQRYIRTAKLYDGGVETELTMRAVTPEGVGRFYAAEYDEVILPAKPSAAIFPDEFNAERASGSLTKRFLVDGLYVDQRMIRVSRDASYSYRLGRETYTTAQPGLDLMYIEPRKIAEQHAGQGYAIYNGGLPGRKMYLADRSTRLAYLPKTISWQYLYEQWHLHDTERVIEQRKRSVHLDHTRLGIPPYNAELTIAITGKSYSREAWRFTWGFLRPHNHEALDRACYAVRVSKSARDKILVQTKTKRVPHPGDRQKVGTITVDQLIEV